MTWNEMDFDDRLEAVYRGARDGKLLKQIAGEHEGRPRDVLEFARANDLPLRTRRPEVNRVPRRKGIAR